MSDVKKAAEKEVAQCRDRDPSRLDAYKSYFIAGAAEQRKRDIAILRAQHERCQPGTLVSYHVAAEVLATTFDASPVSTPRGCNFHLIGKKSDCPACNKEKP